MRRRRKVERGITLMADGYEILYRVRGLSTLPGAAGIMGKPAENGQTFPGRLITREVFNAYRANGWIKKIKPFVTKGWQAWGITDKGREEARQRPNPNQAEMKAARRAGRV